MLVQDRAHPGSKARHCTPAGMPKKMLMDSCELYDLFLQHKKTAPEVKAACTGALGVSCNEVVDLPSQI